MQFHIKEPKEEEEPQIPPSHWEKIVDEEMKEEGIERSPSLRAEEEFQFNTPLLEKEAFSFNPVNVNRPTPTRLFHSPAGNSRSRRESHLEASPSVSGFERPYYSAQDARKSRKQVGRFELRNVRIKGFNSFLQDPDSLDFFTELQKGTSSVC